uniref:transposase n=1 Tax=Candidatus Enterovibrio escicola TaxID=1927127 RepID=UPI0016803381|nr:transposase [Candidatus Enterovibrio escacola]
MTLITGVKNNLNPQVMKLWDRRMIQKRSTIKTIFDQLKNISQINHFRHRSSVRFMVKPYC